MNDLDPRINDNMNDPKPLPTPEIAPEPEPNSKILIWALVIITALIAGIFLIQFIYHPAPQEGETADYNNFHFEKIGGLWTTQWQTGNEILTPGFHYLPQETLNITPKVLPTWNSTQFNANDLVYVVFEPTDDLVSPYVQVSASEIAFKLRAIGQNISAGYSKNVTGDFPERSIVNCNTPNTSVIIVYDLNVSTGIQYEKTCVTIFGHKEELLRATDHFLYSTYGIIPQ